MSSLVFTAVHGERSRTYVFADVSIRVVGVVSLCVRPSGSHRLETSSGEKHIINSGWLAISLDADAWSV